MDDLDAAATEMERNEMDLLAGVSGLMTELAYAGFEVVQYRPLTSRISSFVALR